MIKCLFGSIINPWKDAYKNQPILGTVCHVIVITKNNKYLNTSGIIPTYNGLVWLLSDGKSGYNIEVPFLCGPVISWKYAVDEPDEAILNKWAKQAAVKYYKHP